MSLPFQISQIQIGAPESINKILGNGLIPFLALDGNLYLLDVRGHVSPLSNYSGGSGGIVSDIYYITVGGETHIPNLPDPSLIKANHIYIWNEGTLMYQGSSPDEYQNTSSEGFITLNFTASPNQRFRIAGFS